MPSVLNVTRTAHLPSGRSRRRTESLWSQHAGFSATSAHSRGFAEPIRTHCVDSQVSVRHERCQFAASALALTIPASAGIASVAPHDERVFPVVRVVAAANAACLEPEL